MREYLRQAVALSFLSRHFRYYSDLASSERRILPESRVSCLRRLRGLLDRAYQAALDEFAGIEDYRLQRVRAYLQLAREGKSVVAITRELGLHSRSYVHWQIQRQALEPVTEGFLQLARQIHLEYGDF